MRRIPRLVACAAVVAALASSVAQNARADNPSALYGAGSVSDGSCTGTGILIGEYESVTGRWYFEHVYTPGSELAVGCQVNLPLVSEASGMPNSQGCVSGLAGSEICVKPLPNPGTSAVVAVKVCDPNCFSGSYSLQRL